MRLRTQILKELLCTLRDPRSRMVLIGPPLMQLIIFSYAATLDVRNVDVAVLDQDRGALAREVVERVAAAWFVDDLEVVPNLDALGNRIDRQEVLIGLHIPPDFSASVASGRPGQVQVILDGRQANAAQIALGYLGAIVQELSVELGDDEEAWAASRPTAVTRHWFNPNLIYMWFIVPSLSGILAMMIALLVTALSIARERELGTFDQLLVSPATPLEIIVGKTVPAVVIGTVLALIMILAGIFVFRVPFHGSFGLLFGSLLLFILSVVGIGLMLSAICQTQQQAILGTFAVAIPTVLISGFATPVENMPVALQALAELSPLKHYLVIVQGSFLKAMPTAEILANAWPMIALATVTLSMSVFVVQRRLQ